jgi:drug/metabolite transporter (DMT)-like permease
MSADGTRIAIGAPSNDTGGSNAGQVRIFTWSGSEWTQTGSDINGEEAGESGTSVAMSADGNRIAIGAPLTDDGGDMAGSVRVHTWNGTAWAQTGANNNGKAAMETAGHSVAMAANGTRIAIGAPLDDGISAGIVAVLVSVQPVLTALIASRWMGERLAPRQWAGVMLGFAGVVLIVWHKTAVSEITAGGLVAVLVSLAGVTAGTLYTRAFCPRVDLRSAALVQFAVTGAVLAPLAWGIEGFAVTWAWPLLAAIVFLVIGASILAVNALHTLMRRGAATRVTSLLYLTPIFAVVLEYLMFDIVPGNLSMAGIAVTCAGVAMVTTSRRH